MKASGQQARDYLNAPKQCAPFTLIYGADTARTRKELRDKAKQILGESAQSEMRLNEFDAKTISSDPALLIDSLTTRPFFPGIFATMIFDAQDSFAAHVSAAFDGWREGDGYIFLQAGSLRKTSKLRKLFETDARAMAIGIYDDPMSASDINQMISAKAISLDADAKSLLLANLRALDPSAAASILEMLSLYQGDDDTPLDSDILQDLLPHEKHQGIDDITQALASCEINTLTRALWNAPAQGLNEQAILIAALNHFKRLIAVKSARDPGAAIGKLVPPVFGPRRQVLQKQLSLWSLAQLNQASQSLLDLMAELRRNAYPLPETAYIERNLIRIALIAQKNRSRSS